MIPRGSVITPTPSPSTPTPRPLSPAEDRTRDQPILPFLDILTLPSHIDTSGIYSSHESVFFPDPTDHNSGFISSPGSLDSTLPQVGQEREDWLARSRSGNQEYPPGPRDRAYAVLPLRRPQNQAQNLVSSPE